MSMSQRSIAAYTTRRPYDSTPFRSHARSVQKQLGLGLSPLEDRPADGLLQDLFRLPAAIGQSCNTTVYAGSYFWK